MIYDYMTKTTCPIPSHGEYAKKYNEEGLTEVDRMIITMEMRLSQNIAMLQLGLDAQMCWLYENHFKKNMI